MDFGAFPPEFNSARMYAGAGSGPLMATASTWDGLAAELGSAASSYWSVISGLAGGSWLGPGSAAMAAAAAPYAAWMSATAGQAEQTANQARAAAAAYEAAFAMTVPPPVIAANRAQLMALIATNFLGQNTPAIAATEAHYAEMWAQDAAAMYGYAGSSAAASMLPLYTAPHQNTNSAGPATQAAVVGQVTASSAGTGVQTTLSQMMSSVPNGLQGLASPAASGSGLGGLLSSGSGTSGNPVWDFLNSTFLNGFTSGQWANPTSIMGGMTSMAVLQALLSGQGLDLDAGVPQQLLGAVGPAGLVGTPLGAGVSGASSLAGAGAGGVSAGLGRATLVGALSVPQNWATSAPATSTPVTASLASNWTAVPEAGAAEMAGMPGMPGMPIVNSGARGYGFAAPRYGFRPTVMAHPPAAG